MKKPNSASKNKNTMDIDIDDIDKSERQGLDFNQSRRPSASTRNISEASKIANFDNIDPSSSKYGASAKREPFGTKSGVSGPARYSDLLDTASATSAS
jgi:hypothetical protein